MYHFKIADPQFLPQCGCQVELNVRPGEVWVLTGENGLGKTTLLHRLAQQLPTTERSILEQKDSEYFFDRKLLMLKKILQEGQLASFDHSFFSDCWNDFQLHLKNDRLLSHLSGGESQSLKICLTLAKDSPVYFLDEPSHYLDQQRKNTLRSKLEHLRKQGKIIIIVEHDHSWLSSDWQIQALTLQNKTLSIDNSWKN
jgi:ABC-type Mn2+/Zn2+ transport system ATPase subunit